MAKRPFGELNGGLLQEVEAIVLDSHRKLYEAHRRPWSRPIAYHWLHYEDPMPLERLRAGVEKLSELGATFDADAVDKACALAEERGFSN